MEVEIIPAPGQEKKTAQVLLGLAIKARHVRIAHEGGISFWVPGYLSDLYQKTLHVSNDDGDSSAMDTEAPKRRGRPPKPRPQNINNGQEGV